MDLAGTMHFAGPATQVLGTYNLMNQFGSGTTWNGTYNGTSGYPWSSGIERLSVVERVSVEQRLPWSNGYPWSSSTVKPSSASSSSINFWVPQQ